ncbi:hypothetical protein [Parasediminibacterium sp. JCM 36343]|uniref:hypothetical protein n=1 Tax=Parasediminibacterium sp. JCM 36343 TaxID=3374279 RepID=UPI00397D7EE8
MPYFYKGNINFRKKTNLIEMTTAVIRKKLHDYIANASDNKVKGMYLLLEDEVSKENDFSLTESHLEILKNEKKAHLEGTSKSYDWKEAKEIIKGLA